MERWSIWARGKRRYLRGSGRRRGRGRGAFEACVWVGWVGGWLEERWVVGGWVDER